MFTQSFSVSLQLTRLINITYLLTNDGGYALTVTEVGAWQSTPEKLPIPKRMPRCQDWAL